MASSLVGAMMSAWDPFFSFREAIFWMVGNKKAAVFPVPVWAHPMRSLPRKITGIDFSCMGVASSKPMYPIASIISALRSNSSNFIYYGVFTTEDNELWWDEGELD